MNKFGIVLGAAAAVTLAGCKDPDYKYANASPSQSEVKSVETTTASVKTVEPAPEPVPVVEPVERAPAPAPVVEMSAPAPVVAEPAYTEYVVQEGDYLSKISKRYNVKLASIRRLNPSIKRDVIRVGQKIKLPGKIDVGVQKEPVRKPAKAAKSSASAAYTGATKEYVVKSGDTLGSVAYGNGINIRQLKKLNGLTSDTLKVGQKLKIPSEKVTAGTKKAVEHAFVPAKKAVGAESAPVAAGTESSSVVAESEKKVEPPVAEPQTSEPDASSTPPAPAAAPTATYVVQEGDDMTGVSIRWGVPAAEIRELNNLGENDQLVPGQIIKLPAEAQQ